MPFRRSPHSRASGSSELRRNRIDRHGTVVRADTFGRIAHNVRPDIVFRFSRMHPDQLDHPSARSVLPRSEISPWAEDPAPESADAPPGDPPRSPARLWATWSWTFHFCQRAIDPIQQRHDECERTLAIYRLCIRANTRIAKHDGAPAGKKIQQVLDRVGQRIRLAQQRNPGLEQLLGGLLHVKAKNLVGNFARTVHHPKRIDVSRRGVQQHPRALNVAHRAPYPLATPAPGHG